jgi:hypothetical protein
MKSILRLSMVPSAGVAEFKIKACGGPKIRSSPQVDDRFSEQA